VPSPANPQDFNRYTYVRNNPLVYVDPDGHQERVTGFTQWEDHVGPDYRYQNYRTKCYWMDPDPPPCPTCIAQGASLTVDFIPVVGDVKGLAEVFTGRDLITGEGLGNWRWLGLLGLSELRHVDEVASLARGGFKYLRHLDNAAFERLLRLGTRHGDEITEILRKAGSNSVIRAMTDRAGNQILLRVGNRRRGLRHIVGRHLTGDISGAFTTFFSKRMKVGDIVDVVAQTIQKGDRVLDDETGYWVYNWSHETWGQINVIASPAGEVISAFPD
jgi:hypothetical protein